MGLRTVAWFDDLKKANDALLYLLNDDTRTFPKGFSKDDLRALVDNMRGHFDSGGVVGIGFSLKHSRKIAFIYSGIKTGISYQKQGILWSRMQDRSALKKVSKGLWVVRKGFRSIGWGLVGANHFAAPFSEPSVGEIKAAGRQRYNPQEGQVQWMNRMRGATILMHQDSDEESSADTGDEGSQ